MEENIYRPPSSVVADMVATAERRHFYVVSPTKYWVLMILTIGLYRLYWFYKHWSNYKAATGESMWPVMRSIFSVFFTHSLFREIETQIGRVRAPHEWNWAAWATLYVVAVIAEGLIERIGRIAHIDAGKSLLFSLVALSCALAAGDRAQRAANAAVGDPEGASNSRFTIANWFWIVLGLLLWSLAFVGLTLPAEGVGN